MSSILPLGSSPQLLCLLIEDSAVGVGATVEEFEEAVDCEAKMDAMVESLVESEDEPLTNDPDAVCHNPLSFSLQIQQVINEFNNLMTIFPYLILSPTLLITLLSYQRQRQHNIPQDNKATRNIYSSRLEPMNSSLLISHTSSFISVSFSSFSLPSLLSINSEISTKV